MVCTTTLYRYIDDQRLPIKNIDFQMKMVRQSTKKHKFRHRRLLGKSIEERTSIVDSREEFGHFEIGTVNGKRNGSETALLTLTERQTRFEFIRAIDEKDADSVIYALKQSMNEYGTTFTQVFRTITADNSSEFSQLLTDTAYRVR